MPDTNEKTVSDTEIGQQAKRPSGSLMHLLSMQMIVLQLLLRRSGTLAQQRLFELSEVQWRILTYLGYMAPLSLTGLADGLLQDRGQVSRAVKELVKRGLVSQKRKPGGPEQEINLSAAGLVMHAKLVEGVIARDQALTEGFDTKELEAVGRVVEVMITRARAMLAAEQELSGK